MHLNVHTTTADCKAASSLYALLQQTPAMLITKLLKHITEKTMQHCNLTTPQRSCFGKEAHLSYLGGRMT